MILCLYGGSFDPVHNGHLFYARYVLQHLHPDQIIVMPANRSPFKQENPIDGIHRVEMLKRAFRDEKKITISTWELQKPGPSYTINTIRHILSLYDSVEKLYILAGMDQMAEIKKWKAIDEILSLGVIFAVFPRKGFDKHEIDPDVRNKCIFLEGPVLDISASCIRKKLRKGEDVRDLTPLPVLKYIKENKLYIDA